MGHSLIGELIGEMFACLLVGTSHPARLSDACVCALMPQAAVGPAAGKDYEC